MHDATWSQDPERRITTLKGKRRYLYLRPLLSAIRNIMYIKHFLITDIKAPSLRRPSRNEGCDYVIAYAYLYRRKNI